MSNHTDLIGSQEALQLLGCARSTLNRWAVDGKLPIAVQMPGEKGARLYRREDVLNMQLSNAGRKPAVPRKPKAQSAK